MEVDGDVSAVDTMNSNSSSSMVVKGGGGLCGLVNEMASVDYRIYKRL
jgi:hypothetical protein